MQNNFQVLVKVNRQLLRINSTISKTNWCIFKLIREVEELSLSIWIQSRFISSSNRSKRRNSLIRRFLEVDQRINKNIYSQIWWTLITFRTIHRTWTWLSKARSNFCNKTTQTWENTARRVQADRITFQPSRQHLTLYRLELIFQEEKRTALAQILFLKVIRDMPLLLSIIWIRWAPSSQTISQASLLTIRKARMAQS